MRCLVLGALVLIASTGCGGPSDGPEMRSPQTDLRKEWDARSSADQAAIRKYSAKFSADAVETCVRAYDNEAPPPGWPVYKPHLDLAEYLCTCVGLTTCL
jgi:hypothetical protein